MEHLFISYAHVDAHFVSKLKMKLELAKIPVWVDTELSYGDDWREGIDQAIRKSFAVLVVLSPAADASKYVTYEWACAWGAEIKVIPLLLEPTRFHPRIESLQFIDFSDENNRPWPKLQAAVKKAQAQHSSTNLSQITRNAIEALHNFDPEVRTRAATLLAEYKHEAVVKALSDSLDDPHPSVQEAAVISLGHIGMVDAVPALLRTCRSQNSDLRFFATKSLGQIDDPSVIGGLLQMWVDVDSNVRVAAEQSLEKQANPHAIPFILDVLYADDSTEAMRYVAVELLGKIGEALAVPHLIRILNNKTEHVSLRVAARKSLTKIGTSEALAAIEASQAGVAS